MDPDRPLSQYAAVVLSAALLGLTLFLVLLVHRQDESSPLFWCLVLWALLFAVQAVNPMGLREVSGEATLVLGVGLVALSLPALFSSSKPLVTGSHGMTQSVILRLILACVAAGVLVAVGALAFRSGVSAATGADFGQLTPSQVRAAQTGAARGGGLPALLAGLNPFLACLGVYGYVRFYRLFALATVGAVVASLQTPARLSTVMLIVQAAVFYYYCRRSLPLRSSRYPDKVAGSRIRIMLLAGSAAAVSMAFFNYLGSQLGKVETVAAYFPNYPLPSWTLSPLLYLTGGYPALSTAISSGTDPFQHPNSLFLLARIWAFIDPLYQAPDTLSAYVPIPIPFNVFTGFGQMWYDFGLVGTVTLSALLGLLAVRSHRRAMAGQLAYAWVSSLVASLLLATPQTYRLFFLDVDLALAAGFVFFAWLPKEGGRSLRRHLRAAPGLGAMRGSVKPRSASRGRGRSAG